ncbi:MULTISPECIES: carbohydrate ABC transporter permease [Clostridium]|nr:MULTISPECIES: sugar ABC transporter permease [Clostridium]AQS05565.1 trehalose transport system permease protein SugA [Clostridium beijerinckii]MBA2884927.1 multiple sugar transport system permease protein [Clostridium beijerinckii]MBA2899699.1 multiple sugar transport system permease protein [Clostridium beijerinckii]MBA2909278.1 multiple sugar transport system permease protein [Clostridium beijerinckii]MBA9014851.1 multiple sugar transport system permease protein [Clostridium beijerinckii
MHKNRVGYMFIVPAVIFMLLFVGYPIIYNILLSLQDVNVMTVNSPIKEFVGFKNYIELFKSSVLLVAIGNTLYYTVVCIIFQFVLGFAFALFFNIEFTFSKFIRGLVMVSWLIPMTINALSFKFMFSPSGGVINQILMNLHVINQPLDWLIQPNSAMWGLIITNVWVGIPFNMILLTTGLSTIPKSIYESASLDGANWFQKLFYITIPSIKPAILSVLMLGFIYTFKVFDLVFIMTNGGPVNATEVLSTLSYKLSFNQYSYSQGSAVANILFLTLFIVSLFYVKLIKEDEVM